MCKSRAHTLYMYIFLPQLNKRPIYTQVYVYITEKRPLIQMSDYLASN